MLYLFCVILPSIYAYIPSTHLPSFSVLLPPPGSRSCLASLRPPLPSTTPWQTVHGAGLSLDQAQPHSPGKPERMSVLPGPRPGLVRPATVHRWGLPSLHEVKAGLTSALLHTGRKWTGERNSWLFCPLSRSGAELPSDQRQPQVWAAGGSGPEDAAILGQHGVWQPPHLCGAEWLVGVDALLIAQHLFDATSCLCWTSWFPCRYVLGNTKTKDPKHMYYLKRFIAEALKCKSSVVHWHSHISISGHKNNGNPISSHWN